MNLFLCQLLFLLLPDFILISRILFLISFSEAFCLLFCEFICFSLSFSFFIISLLFLEILLNLLSCLPYGVQLGVIVANSSSAVSGPILVFSFPKDKFPFFVSLSYSSSPTSGPNIVFLIELSLKLILSVNCTSSVSGPNFVFHLKKLEIYHS